MIILDTNVISEALRNEPDERVLTRLDQVWAQTYISAVSVGELHEGINLLPEGKRRTGLEISLNVWLNELAPSSVLPLGEEEAIAFGDLRAQHKKHGTPIGIPDAMIAATCMVHGALLYTRNIKDFKDTGITLLNPWD